MEADSSSNVSLSGLARKIVERNLLNAATAKDAIDKAEKAQVNLVSYLTENNILSSLSIAMLASREFGLPLIDLDSFDHDSIPKDLVTEKLIRKTHGLPLYSHAHRLYVGVSDPTNLIGLDDMKFQTGMTVETVIVEHEKLTKTIDEILSEQEASSFDNLDDADLDSLDIATQEDEDKKELDESEVDDAPIVRFVNKILLDAINQGASDIHFEPYEKTYRIRFRQDGILREVATPPANLSPRLSARLKVMSRLDISERRVPQDGRFKMRISKTRSIDFRVSTCPTLYGEKIVMRILDPTSAKLGIDMLGYEIEQKNLFLEAINKPHGMVLVTGPTGSGKTVSLYTALNILNVNEKNISTAEDPVEINLPGINQVNVNNKIGLTFPAALKSFLRQDPDIIMVGEIRDLETAEIGVKAAQTGHLVLSTLHTNSAAETLTRMVNMGVAPFNLATSVSLIIAQRLARKLCSDCKTKIEVPKDELLNLGFYEEEINEITIFEPVGCSHCVDGYKGRTGIYEVLKVTEEIGRIIMEHGNAMQILDKALEQGMVTMRRAGLLKVKKGITSLEEINRVTVD